MRPAAQKLPATNQNEDIQNEATGFGVERMSCTGTNEKEKSRRNRLTVWTLSEMTDLGHFRLSPDAIGGRISPQFDRLPLRAWVKPLRPRVKVTQARNGMCLKCTVPHAASRHPG